MVPSNTQPFGPAIPGSYLNQVNLASANGAETARFLSAFGYLVNATQLTPSERSAKGLSADAADPILKVATFEEVPGVVCLKAKQTRGGQCRRAHTITWEFNKDGEAVREYEIFSDKNLTNLIGKVSGKSRCGHYRFKDKQRLTCTYYVTATYFDGSQSAAQAAHIK